MKNNKKQFLAVAIFAVVFGWVIVADQTPAKAVPCDGSTAPWNFDFFTDQTGNTLLKERFTCGCINMTGWENVTYPFTIIQDDRQNPTLDQCSCPVRCANDELCKCRRSVDCSAIGGACYRTGQNPTGTRQVSWRCPGGANYTCWVPVTTTPPPPPPAYKITPSDCCTQIVPDIGDPYRNEYSLNHLVQVAINVYECILCIVGALILLMLVAGAFILMTSAGNDSRVGLGKQIISGAVIGGIIVFFSFLIVNFTVKALGARFINEANVQISAGIDQVPKTTDTTLDTTQNEETQPPPPTSTTKEALINSLVTTINCAAAQKEAVKNSLMIMSEAELRRYFGSAFNFVCGGPRCDVFAAYYNISVNGGVIGCRNEIFLCPPFFGASNLGAAGAVVHEMTHKQQCDRHDLQLIEDTCRMENEAWIAQANFLEQRGMPAEIVNTTRCQLIKDYKDRNGVQCQPSDSRCRSASLDNNLILAMANCN